MIGLMKKIPESKKLPTNRTPNAVKPKPGKVIPYREALRVLLSSMAAEALPESIRAELPAIASHWLQTPEEAPLILGKATGDKWRLILSAYADSGNENFMQLKHKRGRSGHKIRIDYSGLPFPPPEKPIFTFSGAVCLRRVGGLWLQLLFVARQFFFECGDLFLQYARVVVVAG
jgi:hypothetical protein